MPIEQITIENRHSPIIVCNHCGQRVRRGDGNAYYKPTDATRSEGLSLVHKRCSPAFEKANASGEGDTWYADELDVWLIYLMASAGYDVQKAKERADQMTAFQESM